ncbi:hypothetical protein XENOCAPTIV_016097 [Xenoophorus captivus]|uniref:Uncharacterized protein n=1 Tax=Xenoophorus captivus TaxID=1517983 RepID=A0ABV0S2H3_9TELE
MMEVVLTRLRDFSCKTSTFDDCTPSEDSSRREAKSHSYHHRGPCTAGREGSRLDIGSALAWLRMELMEMRSQDQALIRQLMELHSGIQELKQELSEEDTDEEKEEEEGTYWDTDSEGGSSSFYHNIFCQKMSQTFYTGGSAVKVVHRRSSVP